MTNFPTMQQLLVEVKPVNAEFALMDKLADQGVFMDDWTFVHYSAIDKLGINPQTKFATPAGIYAYPTKEYSNSAGRFDIDAPPYGSNRPYAHFFRIKESARKDMLILDKEGDVKYNPKFTIAVLFNKLLKMYEQKYRRSNGAGRVYRHLPRPLIGWGAARPGSGPSSSARSAPVQTRGAGRMSEAFDSALKKHPDYNEDVFWSIIAGEDDEPEKMPKNQALSMITFSQIWNAMRLLAGISSAGTRQWAKILNALGIPGIIDEGSGTIHKNEPTQAVFLFKGDLERIITIGGHHETRFLSKKAHDPISPSAVNSKFPNHKLAGFNPKILDAKKFIKKYFHTIVSQNAFHDAYNDVFINHPLFKSKEGLESVGYEFAELLIKNSSLLRAPYLNAFTGFINGYTAWDSQWMPTSGDFIEVAMKLSIATAKKYNYDREEMSLKGLKFWSDPLDLWDHLTTVNYNDYYTTPEVGKALKGEFARTVNRVMIDYYKKNNLPRPPVDETTIWGMARVYLKLPDMADGFLKKKEPSYPAGY